MRKIKINISVNKIFKSDFEKVFSDLNVKVLKIRERPDYEKYDIYSVKFKRSQCDELNKKLHDIRMKECE